MVSGKFSNMQLRHATMPSPEDTMQALNASSSDRHGSADGAVVGGNVPEVGGGATGLVGGDGAVGAGVFQQVRKHPSQLHVSYASMYDPQVPQLLVQASIWLQMSIESFPHVVPLVMRS